MPTTVKLQDMLSYSKVILIVALLIFFAYGVICLIFLLINHNRNRKKVLVVHEPAPVVLLKLKNKYITQLLMLDKRYANEAKDNRRGFEELSRLVRHFVFESTGIRVQNYTLEEIRTLNKASLTELIGSCYPPEFGPEGYGRIHEVIIEAKKVIEEWN